MKRKKAKLKIDNDCLCEVHLKVYPNGLSCKGHKKGKCPCLKEAIEETHAAIAS